MSLAEQIKGAGEAGLGAPTIAGTGPSALVPPAPLPAPPPCSPGPAAQSLRSSQKADQSPRPSECVSTPAESLSADLRSVQASLDRVQGGENAGLPGGPVGATYNAERVLGSGAFGIVYQARIIETGEMVAIKKVLQDARFKNRELEIMQELTNHPNIVELKSAFHVPGDKPKETYLNVVMEYCPETMHNLMSHYTKSRRSIPYELVQIYTYHMLRGVAYLTAKNICHRDIKPPNILIKDEVHELKICDFGSAKRLSKGEPNVAYICSRYYRAPELIFGATDYSTLIDMWSVACVTAEMILQQVLFPGDSGVDQLMEIIKVLGTPSIHDLNAMNPVYGEFKFPQIKSYPWTKIFRSRTTPEAVDWLSKVLQYDPMKRPNGLQACMHKFFDDLRSPHFKTATPLSMFWFSDEELALMTQDPHMRKGLIPSWILSEYTVTQGGPVPRNLGAITQRPTHLPADDPVSPSSLAPDASSTPVESASSSTPGGFGMMPAVMEEKEKERRRRKRPEDKEAKQQEDQPDRRASTEEKRPREGDDGYTPDEPATDRQRKLAPDDAEPVRKRSPRPKKDRGEEGNRSARGGRASPRPRKASHDGAPEKKATAEEGADDGNVSARREKRKGRDRRTSGGSDKNGIEATSSTTGAVPASDPSSTVNCKDEGDALSEFTAAIGKAGGPSEFAHQFASSSSSQPGNDGETSKKPGGLSGGLLAGAGALQLVPSAAATSSLKR